MSDPTRDTGANAPLTPLPASLHTMELSAVTTTSWRAFEAQAGARAAAPGIDPDLGFGQAAANESRQRLLNRDGTFNVARDGLGVRESLSLFHLAMQLRWPTFLGSVAGVYLLSNIVFASLYLLCGPGALRGSDPAIPDGSWLQAFLFSVQTLATIGYGAIVPMGRAANTIVTIEAYSSILLTALATGLTIARFTRPTARIRFSQTAVIAPHRDGWALMLRMANARSSELIELRAQVMFTSFVREGSRVVRRFERLTLEREQVIFFPLAWTLVHPITAESPLWGLTPADLRDRDSEVLVLLSGFDETHAQVVHARTSYKPDEIVWNARFRNIARSGAGERFTVDVSRLDAIERLDGAPVSEDEAR